MLEGAEFIFFRWRGEGKKREKKLNSSIIPAPTQSLPNGENVS
jgi:hypothetical protein